MFCISCSCSEVIGELLVIAISSWVVEFAFIGIEVGLIIGLVEFLCAELLEKPEEVDEMELIDMFEGTFAGD